MTRTLTSLANVSFSLQGLLFYLVLATFCWAYADTFKELQLYWHQGQNWQFLIPVAFVYMLWDRSDVFSGLEIKPNFLWGSLLLACSTALLIAGQLSYTQTLREISLVCTVFSLVLLLFGSQHLRKLFWPLAYLILMTSLPTDLLVRSEGALKVASATAAANMLQWFGYAVHREGNLLYLPHITLEVADECSGLNQLISAIALGVPIAFTMVDKWWKRIAILLLSCAFGIIANWVRVVLIALWNYHTAKENLHGPEHIYQLPFIFLVGVFLTFLVALAIADKQKPAQQTDARSADRTDSGKAPLGTSRAAPLIAIGLLAAAAVYMNTWHVKPVQLEQDLSQFPMSIAGFKGKRIKDLGKPFSTGLAQNELIASYSNAEGVTIKVFVAYFQWQDTEHELVDYRYNWLHDGAQLVDVVAGSSLLSMKRNSVKTERGPETAYFVYDINGRNLTGLNAVKLATLVDAFFYRRTNGAIVVVLFDHATGELAADEQAFLSQFLLDARALF